MAWSMASSQAQPVVGQGPPTAWLTKPDMGLLGSKWRAGTLSCSLDLESSELCCPWVDPSDSWTPHTQALFWGPAHHISMHTFPPAFSVLACLWVLNCAHWQFTLF